MDNLEKRYLICLPDLNIAHGYIVQGSESEGIIGKNKYDALGTRMKDYESVSRNFLTRRIPAGCLQTYRMHMQVKFYLYRKYPEG